MTLTLNEYQELANQTAEYPDIGNNLLYPAMGLCGESGEVIEKIKKLWRNLGKTTGAELTQEERLAIIKEMGGSLWYISALCLEVGCTLNEVATVNIEQLIDRRQRGVIKSAGDNR